MSREDQASGKEWWRWWNQVEKRWGKKRGDRRKDLSLYNLVLAEGNGLSSSSNGSEREAALLEVKTKPRSMRMDEIRWEILYRPFYGIVWRTMRDREERKSILFVSLTSSSDVGKDVRLYELLGFRVDFFPFSPVTSKSLQKQGAQLVRERKRETAKRFTEGWAMCSPNINGTSEEFWCFDRNPKRIPIVTKEDKARRTTKTYQRRHAALGRHIRGGGHQTSENNKQERT